MLSERAVKVVDGGVGVRVGAARRGAERRVILNGRGATLKQVKFGGDIEFGFGEVVVE